MSTVSTNEDLSVLVVLSKANFALGDFVCANRKNSSNNSYLFAATNRIVVFASRRAKKVAKWKIIGLIYDVYQKKIIELWSALTRSMFNLQNYFFHYHVLSGARPFKLPVSHLKVILFRSTRQFSGADMCKI